jgi:predicted hydrocarbon binding protein
MELMNSWNWFRTQLIKQVLFEHEKSVLYWRGKEVARNEKIHDLDSLQQFFHKMSLGDLEIVQLSKSKISVRIYNSPLISVYQQAQNAIAFECGVITATLQKIHQANGIGNAQWELERETDIPYIQVRVSLSPKKD